MDQEKTPKRRGHLVGDEDADDVTKVEDDLAPVLADYELGPGSMLGEYRIEGKAGEGGMGVVYAAVHPMIGKRCAIKVLKKDYCEDPYTVERFVDEARVVNAIGHPNIVDIFAFGEMPNGRSYFVMEWLKGKSLRETLATRRLPLAEVCAIVKPLVRALAAAHDKGVIHRDLKPDNVFLGQVDEDAAIPVKLLDFGIAKLAHEGSSAPRLERTATGAMVGTPLYVSPEQARGHGIDFRTDIYSLGAMLFEMIGGRTPFLADNAMEMVAKHLLEEPPRLSSVVPGVPPALDGVVFAMLQKDPDARPTLATLLGVLEGVRTLGQTQPPEEISMIPLTPHAAASAAAAAAIAKSAVASAHAKARELRAQGVPPARTGSRVAIAAVLAAVVVVAGVITAVVMMRKPAAPVVEPPAGGGSSAVVTPPLAPDAAPAPPVDAPPVPAVDAPTAPPPQIKKPPKKPPAVKPPPHDDNDLMEPGTLPKP